MDSYVDEKPGFRNARKAMPVCVAFLPPSFWNDFLVPVIFFGRIYTLT